MPTDMGSMAWHALTLLLEPMRLGILLIGVVIGLAIGVLPGLNGIVGMAIEAGHGEVPPAADEPRGADVASCLQPHAPR